MPTVNTAPEQAVFPPSLGEDADDKNQPNSRPLLSLPLNQMKPPSRWPLLRLLLTALAWVLLLCPLANQAEPLLLQPQVQHYLLKEHLQVLRDPVRRFTIDELLQGESHTQWQEEDKESSYPNFGITRDAIWLRLPVEQQQKATSWLLEIANPLLDQVDFYLVKNGQVIERFITGDHYPFAQRPLSHRHLLFPLQLEVGSRYELWLRIGSDSSMKVQLHLWQPDQFWKKDQPLLLGYGFVHGMIMLFSLYYLFIFIWTKERSHLYFALFSLFSALTIITIHGSGFQYLWPNSITLQEQAIFFLVPCSSLTLSKFASHLLQLRGRRQFRSRLLSLAAWLSLLYMPVSILLPPQPRMVLLGIVLLYSFGITFIISLLELLQGNRSVRYFIFGWMLLLLCVVAFVLGRFGLLPFLPDTENAIEVGLAGLIVALSFALSARLNEERSSKLTAQKKALLHEQEVIQEQQRNLTILQQTKDELEQNVASRTRDLNNALQELKHANSQLQLLSTVDSLTGVKNRRYFDQTYLSEWRRALRERKPLSLLLIDADHFKRVNDQMGHMAGDECLKQLAQRICRTVTRPSDSVSRYGGEEFIVLLPNTALLGALQIAERIREQIKEEAIAWQGSEIWLTVSIGVTSIQANSGISPDLALQQADDALYRAKSEGRDRVCWSPESS